MISKGRGQGTLEYVIIFAVAVAAIILVVNKFLKPRVDASYDHLKDELGAKFNSY